MSEYITKYIKEPKNIPVKYTYDGKEYCGLSDAVETSREEKFGVIYTTFVSNMLDDIEIVIKCREYVKYPVVEWEIYFTNNGVVNSKIFENIVSIDTSFKGNNPILVSNSGDYNSKDGFDDTYTKLSKGNDSMYFTPSDGRSCNEHIPYYKLMFDGFGLNIAIGWSGKWFANCVVSEDETVNFSAGQERCHTYIKPNETYRAPTITIMEYVGDEDAGVNLWRKWHYDHIMSKEANGEPIEGMMVFANGFAEIPSDEFTKATEENQLASLSNLEKFGLNADVWWIDAGWYDHRVDEDVYRNSEWFDIKTKENSEFAIDQKRWWNVGTWEADKRRFPNGLKPIGEKCDELGTKFLLWFEPERVMLGSKLYIEHPEWLMTPPTEPYPSDSYLLDLGNPDCLKWLSEYIANFIKENNIKWYREDFNFDPLRYWVKAEDEEEDRIGMVENQFIQGFYNYWDYIVEKNPGLLIDSCSAGGRRNDLETMRRAVPLHHTDFGYGYAPIKQAFSYHHSRWIPYYKSFQGVWEMDPEFGYDHYSVPQEGNFTSYAYMNAVAPMYAATSPEHFAENPEDLKYFKETFLPIWEKASPMMLKGDFYGLTGKVKKRYDEWVVFQFNMPDDNEGMIKSMKNDICKDKEIKVKLKGLDKDKIYVFTNAEKPDETFEMSGEEAMREVVLTQEEKSAVIWFYNVK